MRKQIKSHLQMLVMFCGIFILAPTLAGVVLIRSWASSHPVSPLKLEGAEWTKFANYCIHPILTCLDTGRNDASIICFMLQKCSWETEQALLIKPTRWTTNPQSEYKIGKVEVYSQSLGWGSVDEKILRGNTRDKGVLAKPTTQDSYWRQASMTTQHLRDGGECLIWYQGWSYIKGRGF